MNSKMKIRARHMLNFRKGNQTTTNTGKNLKFVRKETVNKMVTHYVFRTDDGNEIHYKMNIFPHLTPVNLPQYKRDEMGSVNVLTYDFLLSQLREIKKLRIVDTSKILRKAA